MFDKICELWNDKGYEILLVVSLIVIGILALFKIGKKGTWSSYKTLDTYKNISKPSPLKQLALGKKVSSGELECRRILQKVFNKPFNTLRPNFLRNPITSSSDGDSSQNFNLELDCFEPSLRLALEYQGQQHYKYIPHFHKNKEAFRNQQYRDELKRRMCKDNKINLIEVPHTVKTHEIEPFIKNKLRMFGYI